ncbi:hypothetical protein NQ317_007575 [Molorchus minor]|uniref:Uncharacterized protein n=1 Tax=Molorchus minor TaxID=1323400 RepID=A0ABQ9J7R3_9CUCU|nr:hypothetical protein NQ317_007575 [Molorchus minor]
MNFLSCVNLGAMWSFLMSDSLERAFVSYGTLSLTLSRKELDCLDWSDILTFIRRPERFSEEVGREALEVLRTAPNQVDLKVCRPPPDVLNCVSPISEVPPPPPRREPPNSLNLSSAVYSTPEDEYYHGSCTLPYTSVLEVVTITCPETSFYVPHRFHHFPVLLENNLNAVFEVKCFKKPNLTLEKLPDFNFD